jgi:hypothetical protein
LCEYDFRNWITLGQPLFQLTDAKRSLQFQTPEFRDVASTAHVTFAIQKVPGPKVRRGLQPLGTLPQIVAPSLFEMRSKSIQRDRIKKGMTNF